MYGVSAYILCQKIFYVGSTVNVRCGRILDIGLSPRLCALSTYKYAQKYFASDGMVDSLQDVLLDDIRNSTTHNLDELLTRFYNDCDISPICYTFVCMYTCMFFSRF